MCNCYYGVVMIGRTHPWVVSLQGMVKEPKIAKSFFQALFIKCFHNYNFFFACLSIACTNVWLEFYFEILKIKKKNIYISN
jgi:hypothetical protein